MNGLNMGGREGVGWGLGVGFGYEWLVCGVEHRRSGGGGWVSEWLRVSEWGGFFLMKINVKVNVIYPLLRI